MIPIGLKDFFHFQANVSAYIKIRFFVLSLSGDNEFDISETRNLHYLLTCKVDLLFPSNLDFDLVVLHSIHQFRDVYISIDFLVAF